MGTCIGDDDDKAGSGTHCSSKHCACFHLNNFFFGILNLFCMGHKREGPHPFQTSSSNDFICKMPSHETQCWRLPTVHTSRVLGFRGHVAVVCARQGLLFVHWPDVSAFP